jgi:hypothetical protein
MKKYFTVLMVLGMILVGQIAWAAPEVEPLQTLDILADNNVNIFDYTFFDSPSEGKLELYDLQNIWGAGAGMRIDVNTDIGSDYLAIEVSGAYNGDKKNVHMLSVALKNKGAALLNAQITRQTPLIINIYNGKLTVAAGGTKRTVANVTSFAGTMMTQSITGKLKVYPGTDDISAGKMVSNLTSDSSTVVKIISILR